MGRGQPWTHIFLNSYFSVFLPGGVTGSTGAPNVDGGAAFGFGGTTFIQPPGRGQRGQGVRGVRSQHLTNSFKGYRRTDEVASKDPTKTGCPPSLIASARQPPTPKGFGGLKTSLFIMACRDVALAFIRRRSRSLVEAAGIEPALSSAKYRDLKGNFQEISSGIRLETVY